VTLPLTRDTVELQHQHITLYSGGSHVGWRGKGHGGYANYKPGIYGSTSRKWTHDIEEKKKKVTKF